MTAASASSQPQEITINESNPPVTTSQLLAQFAAKRGQPYGSIPPPSSAANPNQPDSNSNLLKSKSTRASSIKKSHHHHSISSSPIITESSSGGSNANTPSSSASSSLNSNLNQSSSSDRQSKSQIPSSSVPNDSGPSIPSLYDTSRGRTRNVSPSSRWERRCTSANVSSPAASEDGNSTANANNRIRNGILEGDEVASSTTTTRKGKERQRDEGTNHHEDDRRAISSSRERRKVENWIRKGDADNQGIEGTVSDRVKSTKSRVRRKRKEDEQNSLSSSSLNRHRSSNSMDHSTDQRRRSSLLPPLSPPRSSENNVTFRGRSSTLVPLTSTTSPSPIEQVQSINASSNLAKDQDLKLDRSFAPSLTRPHGALFSSDLDDEVLFSDSCSSDFSSEDALVGEGTTTRSRERLDQEDGDSFEDDDEEDEEEEYSVSSTSASNSLISNSRPSLSRSTSTSPNASSEKRSSRSSHRNDSGRVIGRRRNPISEGGGSSSQASSVSPVKRGGILSSIKSENSTSRENIDGKRSKRRKRRISSVERGRRRELRVLLAPPSPASNSNLDLNSNGLETNVDEVGSLSDASKGTQTHSSIRSRISTVGDEDSDREVLEFKSKNQRRGGNNRSEMPTIVDDPMTSPAVSMIRSKSDEVHQQSLTTESQSSTPKLNSSNPNSSSLLNLGQLPGRKWLRNWSSSSSSSQPVSSESRSSSVPSLVPKSSFSPSESSFQRSPRDRTSTVPYFVPADADPLGSNDLDDKDSNDLKEGFAVDDLIQVESVVYDAEEEPPSRRVESPTFSKTSWGKKFSSTMNKSRTNSVSSLASEGGEAQFKLNPNPPTRSSTLLSTSSTLPPVILSAQTSHADGSTTEEKLRRTSMNAANEQERRRGFAVAYAARLANVGTNLWNWNRGTNNNQNSNHQRVRSGSIGSSNSTASTIGESEDRPSNAGNQIDSETGNNGNSSILASGWRNLTRLPNLILMPASVANPPQQPSTSSLDRINKEGQEYDHPALTFLNSSNQVTSEEEREKNVEVLRAQREIALKMGPPSSPSPPASPSFNKSSTSSSLVSSPDLASQNQSLDSSQILGGASKRLSEDQSESRKHQHSSSTSSDSNASATKQSDSSNGRKYSMSTHSKGARGVLSAWEGDFDSGAYVSGLGQPIDPDTELSSVVHLQTFRSRSRDRRDRNELSTHSSSSKESSSKSFDLSKDQSQKQRIGRSASASALDDEDEDEEDEKHVSAAGNRGKRNSLDRIDNSSVRQLDGKLSRREQSRSDGSETMSQNTLLFRYRSPSASTGTATTSTTKKPILAEAQRANLDDKKLASPPTSSSAQLLSSTNASASESALKSLNPALSDPRQDQAAELDSDSKITSQINEEVKGLRRASSLIDFSEQRRFAAREEERKRELQSDLNHRNDNKDGVPPNAVWNLRSRQTRPLMPKRARSYRPAAESPVEEDFCAFPNAISSNGEAEHSDASLSSSSSSTSSSSISSVKDEERIKTSRDGSQREKNGVSRGRSGRACRRRDESPTSSNPRQCAVGLFSAGGHGNRRKSNANSDLSNSSPAPRRDAKSSPNLPGLSRQAERQRENEDADQPVGRIGRRSRRGSKDEEVTQSPSQEVDEGETRGRNSRGRAGDVKVVSSSHGQTACQPYPLPSISLGLNLSSSPSSTSRSRSNRHSNSSNHSHTANGNRNSNHRTGRILPRPSSAPNLGKVLLQATKNQDPSLVNGPNQSKDDQSLVSITSSKSAGELESSENISSTQEPQLNSNATVPSSSDQQAKIPPARAPPQNSQAAQNQSQYSNPTPRPTLLSNGAHLLMLSLELEMIRKRKISAPLKPRWGKQRIRPGVSFTNPSTPIDNGENGGDSTLSSASTSEGVNMRKGSGLRYEVLS